MAERRVAETRRRGVWLRLVCGRTETRPSGSAAPTRWLQRLQRPYAPHDTASPPPPSPTHSTTQRVLCEAALRLLQGAPLYKRPAHPGTDLLRPLSTRFHFPVLLPRVLQPQDTGGLSSGSRAAAVAAGARRSPGRGSPAAGRGPAAEAADNRRWIDSRRRRRKRCSGAAGFSCARCRPSGTAQNATIRRRRCSARDRTSGWRPAAGGARGYAIAGQFLRAGQAYLLGSVSWYSMTPTKARALFADETSEKSFSPGTRPAMSLKCSPCTTAIRFSFWPSHAATLKEYLVRHSVCPFTKVRVLQIVGIEVELSSQGQPRFSISVNAERPGCICRNMHC